MEVAELNVFLSDFEAGVNCLQNPSLLSRVPVSDLRKLPQFHAFLKWGALVFALIATFTGLIRRIKLLIFRFCRITLLASCRSPTQKVEEVHCGFDEDDDESCSVSPSDDDDYVPTMCGTTEEDHCVAGSSCFSRSSRGRELRFRRRTGSFEKLFSWPDFAAGGKSVVKLWDSLGLGFDLDDEDEARNGFASIWDLNRDEKIGSFCNRSFQFPTFSASSSPAMIFSAGSGENRKTLLDIYDTRMGSRTPAIYAEWQPMDGDVVGISSGGVEKVYVRDNNSGTVTVGDMRNVKATLENLTESPGGGWWDAAAVILADDDSQ